MEGVRGEEYKIDRGDWKGARLGTELVRLFDGGLGMGEDEGCGR